MAISFSDKPIVHATVPLLAALAIDEHRHLLARVIGAGEGRIVAVIGGVAMVVALGKLLPVESCTI